MDMGGMDDMGGDMGSMPMSMDMTLKMTCKVGPLLFPFWNIQTCGQYWFSLAVIAIFSFLRHLFAIYKNRLVLQLPTTDNHDTCCAESACAVEQAGLLTAGALNASCCSGGTYSAVAPTEQTKLSAAESGHPRSGSMDIQKPPIRLRIGLPWRLLLTAYFSVLGLSSMVVMLLAMSFNVGVIAAVMLGEALGHFFYSTDFFHNLLVASGTFH